MWEIHSEQRVLLVSMHHAITDGWSATVLQNDLATAYAAAQAGSQPAWDPLPVQLVDHAAWQRAALDGKAMDTQLAWWEKALAGAPPLLELPWDRQRPDAMSFAGADLEFSMPAETGRGLLKLAAANQTTTFVVAYASLQVSADLRLAVHQQLPMECLTPKRHKAHSHAECRTPCRLRCP